MAGFFSNVQKPCRVCTDFKTWMHNQSDPSSHQAKEKVTTFSDRDGFQGGPSDPSPSASNPSPTLTSPWGSQEPQCPCPPDSIELGRHTWTFLHTFAAYFPDPPTPTQQAHAKNLMRAMSTLYPCEPCADHLKDYLQRNPPKVNSHSEINQWMCEFHNEVNANLGKPKFDCSRVLERWKESMDTERCG